jgi:hypothetical protein
MSEWDYVKYLRNQMALEYRGSYRYRIRFKKVSDDWASESHTPVPVT